jgi:hypothetical protein
MKLKFILTTLLLGLFWQGYSCKCGGPGTVKESFASTDLIVHGKVISIDTVLLPETIKEVEVKGIKERLKNDKRKLQDFEMTHVLKIGFEIIEKYKGSSHPKKVVIYTPLHSATCGYRFKKGKEYIVYASTKNFFALTFQNENETTRLEKENTFWTIHCTRTAEYAKSEAAELRRVKK